MKPDIEQILYGLVWSINQLQSLIPVDRSWDFKTAAIVQHKRNAQELLDNLDTLRFPYTAKYYVSGETFIPAMIDYDDRQVWHQKNQVSGDGEWVCFSEIILTPNPFFKI